MIDMLNAMRDALDIDQFSSVDLLNPVMSVKDSHH